MRHSAGTRRRELRQPTTSPVVSGTNTHETVKIPASRGEITLRNAGFLDIGFMDIEVRGPRFAAALTTVVPSSGLSGGRDLPAAEAGDGDPGGVTRWSEGGLRGQNGM
nr:hypothetical protein [Streptomyces sp. NRRL S-1022]